VNQVPVSLDSVQPARRTGSDVTCRLMTSPDTADLAAMAREALPGPVNVNKQTKYLKETAFQPGIMTPISHNNLLLILIVN